MNKDNNSNSGRIEAENKPEKKSRKWPGVVAGAIITAFLLPLLANVLTPMATDWFNTLIAGEPEIPEIETEEPEPFSAKIVDAYVGTENHSRYVDGAHDKFVRNSTTLMAEGGLGVTSRNWIRVEHLETLEYPDPELFACFRNGELYLIAANNGLAQSQVTGLRLEFARELASESMNISYEDAVTEIYRFADVYPGQADPELCSLEGGEISEIFSFRLNEKLKSLIPECNGNYLSGYEPHLSLKAYAEFNGEKKTYYLGAFAYDEKGEILFGEPEYGGAASESINYAIIRTELGAGVEYDLPVIPDIDPSLLVNTYIIPDRPCVLTYTMHYRVNGEIELVTEPTTCSIAVPLFDVDRMREYVYNNGQPANSFDEYGMPEELLYDPQVTLAWLELYDNHYY